MKPEKWLPPALLSRGAQCDVEVRPRASEGPAVVSPSVRQRACLHEHLRLRRRLALGAAPVLVDAAQLRVLVCVARALAGDGFPRGVLHTEIVGADGVDVARAPRRLAR